MLVSTSTLCRRRGRGCAWWSRRYRQGVRRSPRHFHDELLDALAVGGGPGEGQADLELVLAPLDGYHHAEAVEGEDGGRVHCGLEGWWARGTAGGWAGGWVGRVAGRHHAEAVQGEAMSTAGVRWMGGQVGGRF